jgi:hypothetical protein
MAGRGRGLIGGTTRQLLGGTNKNNGIKQVSGGENQTFGLPKTNQKQYPFDKHLANETEILTRLKCCLEKNSSC